MKRTHSLRVFSIVVFTALVAVSCFKDEYDTNVLSKQIELRPELSIPIGKGTLSITDYVAPDDSIVFVDGDSIKIIFTQDSLFSFVMDDFFNIPDQDEQIEDFELGTTEVEPDTFTRVYTLDELSDRTSEPTRTNIRSKDGTNDIFPIIPLQDLGRFEVDSLNDFSWIEVDSGFLYITVKNNLPIVITSMTISIKNDGDDSNVTSSVFTNIPAGGEQTRETDLEGVTMTNQLYAEITDISSPGSAPNNVAIDLADDVATTVYTSTLKVKRGNAILPEQIFEERYTNIPVKMDEPGSSLSLLELESGQIDYNLVSYIQENIVYEVILPNTTLNGEVYTREIPLESEGQTAGVMDLANTITTLVDDSIPVVYRISLNSSGQRVNFDFTNAINYQSTLGVSNIGILAAEGNFGSDTILIDPSTFQLPLEGFDYFTGTFDLTNPTINFVYTNSYGIPMKFQLDMTGAYATSPDVFLEAPPMDINIPANRNSDPINGTIVYDKTSVPDIVNFVRFPPADSIIYTGEVFTNPNGENDNFIRKTSNIDIGLEMELPLEVRANNISIMDTIPFSLSQSKEDSTSTDEGGGVELEIGETSLYYNIENGFPFDLTFSIIAYDSINDIKYDTIEIDFLTAADVDINGIVDASTISSVENVLLVEEDFMNNLYDNANSIILIGNLNTTKDGSGNAKSVKVLTTYGVSFQIGISTNLKIRP